jgi:hypothetical protein
MQPTIPPSLRGYYTFMAIYSSLSRNQDNLEIMYSRGTACSTRTLAAGDATFPVAMHSPSFNPCNAFYRSRQRRNYIRDMITCLRLQTSIRPVILRRIALWLDSKRKISTLKMTRLEEASLKRRNKRDKGLGRPRLVHQALRINIRGGKMPSRVVRWENFHAVCS